jgi:hypothetical protein
MKQTITIDKETAQAIDAVRGALSRDEYIDILLKKHKGVTLSHPPSEPAINTELEK